MKSIEIPVEDSYNTLEDVYIEKTKGSTRDFEVMNRNERFGKVTLIDEHDRVVRDYNRILFNGYSDNDLGYSSSKNRMSKYVKKIEKIGPTVIVEFSTFEGEDTRSISLFARRERLTHEPNRFHKDVVDIYWNPPSLFPSEIDNQYAIIWPDRMQIDAERNPIPALRMLDKYLKAKTRTMDYL